MNTNYQLGTQIISATLKTINLLLCTLNIVFGILLLFSMNARLFFEAVTEVYYPSQPLLGSYILNVLLHGATALVYSVILTAIILKEFSPLQIRQILLLNTCFLIVQLGLVFLIGTKLYVIV
ncbi:hypothetical protein [Litoribrevibacter albus]|uniref:hypothetical protein n=1 Tax=Litoribrevibacter albus TaxID=1473156 RepID=UPI0024E1698D|nr:hypothetical protein [Litoribrevibacter albus]